jgi:hypothetical protein
VDLLGQPYCAGCRQRRVAQMQGGHKRVYSSNRRQLTMAVIAIVFLALFLGPLLLALILLAFIPKTMGWLQAVVALGGFATGVGACMLANQWLFLFGNSGVRRDLGEKLATNGVAEAWRGLFVGLSPGAERKQWDGESDWDVGFLVFQPGWLTYYGDQLWFYLRPEQVERVEIDPPKKSGLKEPRLNLTWRDAATGLTGVLSISVRDLRNRWGQRPAQEALVQQIEAWRAQPVSVAVAPNQPLPPVMAPGATDLPGFASGEPGAFGRSLLIAIPVAILGGGGIALLGKAMGARIPIYGVIPILIGVTFALSAAWEKRLKEKKK